MTCQTLRFSTRPLVLVLACVAAGLAASAALAQQNPFDPTAFPRSAPLPGPVRFHPTRFTPPASPAAITPAPLLNMVFPAGPDKLFGGPPDPSSACGPRGILSIGNYRVLYTLKGGGGGEGNVYYDRARGEFFGDAHPNNSYVDPRVLYDPHSGRFFVITLEVPLYACVPFMPPSSTYRSYLRVAVSTSDHPKHSTDWLNYSFDVTKVVSQGGLTRHYAPDYPAFAVDPACLTVSANYFEMPLPCRGQSGVGVITLSKSALLAGNATPLISFSAGLGEFALSPVSDLWGAGSGQVTYLVEWPLGITNSLRLWALNDPLGARTLSFTNLVIPDHGFGHPNMGVPQCPHTSGATRDLRSWAGTAQGIAQMADGSIWFCGTGTVPDGVGGIDRMRVHYYRLAPNGYPNASPALEEAGVLDAGTGVWNFSPSIGATPDGDIGIVFTQSSPTSCPRMLATLRPAGATDFPAPLEVASSPEFYANHDAGLNLMKWGDYAAVSVDPIDQSVWVGHMVGAAGQVWPQPPLPPGSLGYPAFNVQMLGNLLFEDVESSWPASGRIVRSGQTAVHGLSATPDGAGGVLALWTDKRDTPLHQRRQRITAAGALAPGWATNGTIQGRSNNANPGTVLADGAGGAYIVRVEPSLGLVADRMTPDGQRFAGWPASEVSIAPNAVRYRAVSDGGAGVFVAWSAGDGIRVQRVSAAGATAWSAPLLSTLNVQAELCPDGAGGAFVSWTGSNHVFVKHVTSVGEVDATWPASGVDLGTSNNSRLLADGAGGVYVVYSAAADLRALRLTSAGVAAGGWAGGRDVAVAPGNQIEQVVAADGAGGLLVCWGDTRDGATSGEDIYVTRLDADGDRASGWTAQGTRVCGVTGVQRKPALAGDGAGGALVAWVDGRSDPECSGAGCGEDVLWSHVHADGGLDPDIPEGGAVVSSAAGDQGEPVMTRAGEGFAIVTWLDGSLTPDGDPAWFTRVLAQRVGFDFTPVSVDEGGPVLADGLARPEPNPATHGITTQVRLAQDHPGRRFEVAVYDVAGRLVRTLQSGPARAGSHAITWDLKTGAGARVSAGLYFVRMVSPGGEFARGVVVY